MTICASEFKSRSVRLFVLYAIEQINRYREELAYRIYMSDALRGVALASGCKADKRYFDLIIPVEIEKRSGAEIVASVIGKAGLKVE